MFFNFKQENPHIVKSTHLKMLTEAYQIININVAKREASVIGLFINIKAWYAVSFPEKNILIGRGQCIFSSL